MKNVLVIVYYFPPMGGSGVQRPLKFVKYLREFGWNPIVLCPEPGAYSVFDNSLQEELDSIGVEVHRVRGNTPFHFFTSKNSSQKLEIPNQRAKYLRKLSKLIYYPDNKRGWIKPAIKKGKELIASKSIKLIFSSAPPFSNHLAASALKRETGIPLILDYRDSWLNNHFMTDLMSWQKSILKTQEYSCLEVCNAIIGLDDIMLKSISANHPELSFTNKVITHGFDYEDFEINDSGNFDRKEGRLNILYSGLFYESNQPDVFLTSLKELIDENKVFEDEIYLHFQGGLDKRINELISSLSLDKISKDYGYLNHIDAVSNLRKADLLWMISNFSKDLKQLKSGKLFEYFGSAKPILGLVHPGSAANFLERYNSGFTASPDNKEAVKKEIFTIYKLWKTENLPVPDTEFISKFNRRELTSQLASIFNVISN